MKRYSIIEVMALLIISLGLSGCVGFQAFPLAARSGDTISLAVGGSPSHEQVPGDQITLNDLTITIQQDINGNGVIDANEKFPVKKRYLFRLYPDMTSEASNFLTYATPVGQWSVVLDLVDPSTNAALPLIGNCQATVVVTTSKLQNNRWGTFEGSLNSIPVTILPGAGQSNNFNDNPALGVGISNLPPLPQLAISFSGSGNVAAVSLDIDYDETVLTEESYFRVRQDISMPDVTLNQHVYSDSGNKKMRILLMTNKGTLAPSALKCFIVWKSAWIPSGRTVTANTFNVTSAKFYDDSGAAVPGLGINNVVMTLLYQ